MKKLTECCIINVRRICNANQGRSLSYSFVRSEAYAASSNEDVLKLIKEIMQVYHQDKKPKCDLATLMKDCLDKKLARIDKTANNYNWWYETIKHSETFIDLYEDELNAL